MKTVVILGNGFDLDLGLKTSYRDFVTSHECGKLRQGSYNNLLSIILNKFYLQNWIDLEEELRQTAVTYSSVPLTRNRCFKSEFNDISKGLHDYLVNVQNTVGEKKLRNTSCAALLLEIMCQYPSEFEIYSFNYTDLNKLARSLGYDGHLNLINVHGSLNSDIVLGFEDDVPGLNDFHYMIKSFNPNYSTSHVRDSLSTAKEVIIFGHSLGSTDYPYFAEFFSSKSSEKLSQGHPTRISIVTYNEEAKLSILRQLKVMNNNRTDILMDRNDVTFFMTNNWMAIPQFHHLLQRLKIEAHAKSLFLKWQNEDNLMKLSKD